MKPILRFSRFTLVVLLLTAMGCQYSEKDYFARGERLYEEGKYEEAAINYQNVIKKDPKSVEAYHKLGLCAFSRGDASVATAAMTFAHQLAPDNLKVSEDLADLTFEQYLTSGRTQVLYDRTNKLIADILAKSPSSQTALRLQASILYGDGKLKQSIEIYRAVNNAHPSDPAIVLPLADALRLDGQPAEAERLALGLISSKPDFSPAYDWLAGLYNSTGRSAETESILRKRIARNPKDASSVIALARFYRTDHRDADLHHLLQTLESNTEFPDRYMLVGDFYNSAHDWPSAERCFRAGIDAQKSERAVYLTRLAALYLAQNRDGEALTAAEQATHDQSYNAQAQAIRLAILVKSNDPAKIAQAITSAQDLMRKWPKDGRYPAALASAYRAQGNEKQASMYYEQAVRLDKEIIEPRIALAEFSRQKRDTNGVFRYSEEVLTIDPRNVQARLLHAWGWMDRRDFESAEAEMKALVQDAGDSEDVRFQAALLFIEEKKTGQAIEVLAGLLKNRPGDERILAALATAYVQERAYDAAIKMVSAEVQKDPASQPKRSLLANLAERLGFADLALQNFRILAQGAPASPEYPFEIGKIYEATGDRASAIASFEKAVQLNPSDATMQGRLAMAYYAAGKMKQAEDASSLSVKLDPSDAVLLNNRAYMLAESGLNPDEALKLIQTALVKNPDNPALSDTLAFCYIKKNLSDNAASILNRIIVTYPNEPMFRYHLALALIQKGDSPGARRELQQGLARRPSKEDQAKIRDLLATLG